jgi:hypothetical protein
LRTHWLGRIGTEIVKPILAVHIEIFRHIRCTISDNQHALCTIFWISCRKQFIVVGKDRDWIVVTEKVSNIIVL